jgi:hypothetical protein
MVSTTTRIPLRLFSQLSWAYLEVLRINQTCYLVANISDTEQLDDPQTFTITYVHSFKAISTTKADISILQYFVFSVYHYINKVMKNIISILGCINMISKIISTNKLLSYTYTTIVSEDPILAT